MIQSLTMLVHGLSKSGKSLLSVSGPPPRVYLDVESAARFLPIRGRDWDPAEPPPVPDESWDTAVVAVRHWSDAIAALQWLDTGEHPFRSVSVDSVSELQFRYLEAIAGRSSVKIDQWGTALREVGGFCRDLRDLTFHPVRPMEAVIVTAMTREVDNWMRPHLQGQMASVIPYLFDICGYLYVSTEDDREVRRLLTRRRDNKEAGERVGGRIPALLTLPQVTGETNEEIAARNTTFVRMMGLVFKGHGIAPAATVDTDTGRSVPAHLDSNGAPAVAAAATATEAS
ncbi:MAG: AAA family ATPase [Dermatophilaceae bacterium]